MKANANTNANRNTNTNTNRNADANTNADGKRKKPRAWERFFILIFLLAFVLSSCSFSNQKAGKERGRLEVVKPPYSLSTPLSAERINHRAAQKNKSGEKSTNSSISKLKPYYYPECTISIKEELIQSQEDERIFHTALMSHLYYLGEEESLGTLDTGGLFKAVVEKFEKTRKSKIVERSNQLSREISRDGVSYDVGYFKTYTDGMATYVSLIMVPQKNMLITHILSFGHVEPEKKNALEELELMHRNIIFHRGSQDYVSGNTFLVGKNSKLSLQDDGTFKFYRSQNDHQHDYYEGEYEVFYGEEAFEKLTSMSHYNIKRIDLEEELENNMREGVSLERNTSMEYLSDHKKDGEDVAQEMQKKYTICKDTFYAIILHNKALVTSPTQKDKMGHDTLYVGYYIDEEKTLSLLNANAGSSAIWKFMKKSEKEKY